MYINEIINRFKIWQTRGRWDIFNRSSNKEVKSNGTKDGMEKIMLW